MKRNQAGFTLVELILVMAIATVLLGFITFNLVGEQKTVSVNGIADTIVSDMSSQQNKAMLGEGSESSYGIYFQSDKYTLFKGSSYSANDPSNFVVNIDPGYGIENINFINGTLVFSAITGQVSGYAQGSDSVTVEDERGTKIETVKVNRYGVVIQEN